METLLTGRMEGRAFLTAMINKPQEFKEMFKGLV
jgi:hypothetical protein